MQVEFAGEAARRAKPITRRAPGRVSVFERPPDVAHSWPTVDSKQFDPPERVVVDGADHQFAATSMPQHVRRKLRRHNRGVLRQHLRHQGHLRQHAYPTPGCAYMGLISNRADELRFVVYNAQAARQRVIVTRVPSPTRDSISNSFTSRRAPESPSPN